MHEVRGLVEKMGWRGNLITGSDQLRIDKTLKLVRRLGLEAIAFTGIVKTEVILMMGRNNFNIMGISRSNSSWDQTAVRLL